ncbi:SulP family inorganic anion transporter [Ekhidna sp.]
MNQLKKVFPMLEWLPGYKKEYLNGDVFAGITVGVMLIPQGMAYALIAGLPPVYGLYVAIVPPVIYAIFGTSRQLSVGPVAMDSLLVATGVSVLATEGTDAYISFTILLAFFVGVFQLLLGAFKLGFITNLLSKPVISGFTSAIAVIIGFSQLKYFLGIDILKSSKFYEIVISIFDQIDTLHLVTMVIGIVGILSILLIKKFSKYIPASLVAVVLGIVAVYLMRLDQNGVSIVKEIPKGLPSFAFPDFSLGKFGSLIPLAFTISVISFIEAFSIGKSLEALKGDHSIVPNKELIGVGTANFVGSFFMSFPATGGFSRTAVNQQAGANTPLASIISAVIVALTLLFLTPVFYYLPHAVLASIIMVAVVKLFDFRYATRLYRENRPEFLILMVTFLVTLNVGMVTGILVGVVSSILFFLYRVAYPHIARLGRIKGHHEFRNVTRFDDLETWEGLMILRIDGPLSFINIQGILQYFKKTLETERQLKQIIIDAGPVSHLDATAADGLINLMKELNQKGVRLVFCDVIGPVRDTMKRTGLTDLISEENLFLSINEALDNALTNANDPFKKVALQTNE